MIAIVLFMLFTLVVVGIYRSEHKNEVERWTAFIYTHGFDSGQYRKIDDLTNYSECKTHAETLSAQFDHAPWECGRLCRFDNQRQGYQCQLMKND